MPKSKYPKSVRDLPDKKYNQWTSVYHSARDSGDSKETAAKKAWGAVNEAITGDPDIQRSSLFGKDREPSVYHQTPDSPTAPWPMSEEEKKEWYEIYQSAVEAGVHKLDAREKAWDTISANKTKGRVKRETTRTESFDLQKFVKNMVKEELKLLEMSQQERRMMDLERLKTETGTSFYEMLEDILEFLDDETWEQVMKELRNKYGYRL